MRPSFFVLILLFFLVATDLGLYNLSEFQSIKEFKVLLMIVGSLIFCLGCYSFALFFSFWEEEKPHVHGVFKRRVLTFIVFKLLAGCVLWGFLGPIDGNFAKNAYYTIFVNLLIVGIVDCLFAKKTYESDKNIYVSN